MTDRNLQQLSLKKNLSWHPKAYALKIVDNGVTGAGVKS